MPKVKEANRHLFYDILKALAKTLALTDVEKYTQRVVKVFSEREVRSS
jgi:hypothetical protein